MKHLIIIFEKTMKNTVLRNAIVWSNTSPQDVPNAMKQNNFTLHPIVTLPDL